MPDPSKPPVGIPVPTPGPDVVPVKEPEPERLPDEIPNPNPDEKRSPPTSSQSPGRVLSDADLGACRAAW